MSPAGEKKQTTTKKKKENLEGGLCLTWQLSFNSLFLESLLAGSLWPCWFLREIKQQEQMAPGRLVSQQVKLKDAAVLISGSPPASPRRFSSLPPSLTFLISGADLGPLAVKYVFITSVFTEVPPCLRDWPIDHRHERGLWSHQSLIIQPSNSLPLVQSLARLPITSYSSHSAAVSLVAVTLYAVLIKASGTDVCCVLHNT